MSNTGDFTWSCWFKTTASGANNNLLSFTRATTGNRVYANLSLGTTNKVVCEIAFATPSIQNTGISTTNTYNDGNWHFVVLRVYNTTGAMCKINMNDTAEVVTDATPAANVFNFNSEPTRFNVGCFYNYFTGANQYTLNGTIDEVGVRQRAISDAEVTQLYNAGAGLTYPFSGGAAVQQRLTMLGVGS